MVVTLLLADDHVPVDPVTVAVAAMPLLVVPVLAEPLKGQFVVNPVEKVCKESVKVKTGVPFSLVNVVGSTTVNPDEPARVAVLFLDDDSAALDMAGAVPTIV
jgi:hypothetical protein